MSKYKGFDLEKLRDSTILDSEYKKIVNQEPFPRALQEIEVLDDATGQLKKVKAMKLSAVYSLLDSIYFSYNISTPEIRQIGKAIIVSVRLETIDLDGVIRFREGTGFVDASGGVRHATAMAEANAIKNAAKKLGKIFGRDLYAEDEKTTEKTIEQDTKLETQKAIQEAQQEEEVNPVYLAILKQLGNVKEPQELKRIGQNVLEKTESGDLDEKEFEHIADLINKQFENLKRKQNETKVKQSRSAGKIPSALHGGVVNATANKSRKRSGGTIGNSKKTTR